VGGFGLSAEGHRVVRSYAGKRESVFLIVGLSRGNC